MTYFARRTCTETGNEGPQSRSESSSRLLEEFRDAQAYVLLGAPGAGKTAAFEVEADAYPDGVFVSARDFDTFDDRPEWHDATLFIDGLDERRAGWTDGGRPLDCIRNKLKKLGRPRFRLSCRHADWFGANDHTHLEKVSRSGKIQVLQLDPLSEDDIRKILTRNHHVEDPAAFITSARESGIEGLLDNPQNLKMLAEAVADGEWPETRTQTLELACGKLALEPNREHRIANADRPDVSRLLDAAGRLCAVQLLSGSAGYALEGDASDDPDYPGLEHISGEERRVLRHALCTRLFEEPTESLSSEGRRIPAHRQTAEFLAARYLAGLIENGLPPGRILALMTGHDGTVVSELRGLCAWLAAHSRTTRAGLIARDPLGTVLYGDVRGFSFKEKRGLIDGIKREAKRYAWLHAKTHSPLGDLATPDVVRVFCKELGDPARDDAWQSFVAILLEALVQTPTLGDLGPRLLEIVRDDTWKPSIRSSALDLLIQHQEKSSLAVAALTTLIESIHEGTISDPDDDLLGALLPALYPSRLSLDEVLRHLRAPKDPSLFGRYYRFWAREVPERSTQDQLTELVDHLVLGSDHLRSVFQDSSGQMNPLRQVPFRVLKKLIESSKASVTSHQLFEWFGLASDSQVRPSVECARYFRSWLNTNPGKLKDLIKLGLERCTNSRDFSRCVRDMERRLFNTPLTSHFGRWYLQQAESATNPEVAEYLICRVADSVYPDPCKRAPSREEVEQRLAGDERLLHSFNQRLKSHEEIAVQERRIRESDDEAKNQRQREWYDHVMNHQEVLREYRCNPAVLNQFALAYFGHYVDVEGRDPQERIGDLVGNDEKAIQTVLNGLHGTIDRDDLPTGVEILDLYSQNERHFMALPYMAGLEEAVNRASNRQVPLDEKQQRLGLTIYYVFRIPRSPSWLAQVLDSHPELVSDVLIYSLRPRMRRGEDVSADLSELTHTENYTAVARLSVLPLLKAFPVRCRERQLRGLDRLLQAALIHVEKAPLLKLIERRIDRSSMNMGQRVYWMVAGLMLSADAYLGNLESYVGGNERRVRCLAQALAGYGQTPELIRRLNVRTLEVLIRLIGASFRPWTLGDHRGKVHILSRTMETSDLARLLIDQLGSDSSREAAEVLESLARDDGLLPWRTLLTDAGHRQNVLRRESCFRHCDIGQVLQALDNRKPANVADLAALTIDCLREIAHHVRDGNTSGWRQFWNLDCHNRPESSRPENACRDALLSALQYRLGRLGIDATREGSYADDKRSDIRVSYGGFNVPVEIKKSSHRDLWRAIGTQLIAKYARNPEAGGYGIYLVFWFGEADCQPPGSGLRPRSVAELQSRLMDTLSPDEANLISICVIDVAKPQT